MGQTIRTSHGIFEEISPEQMSEDNALATAANRQLTSGVFGRAAGDQSQINQQTIEAIQGTQAQFLEQFQRDQGYVGNNSQNVGYILEQGARYITSRLTPVVNRTPRIPMPGIDKVNYRTVLDLFGGTGPALNAGIIDQGGTPNKVSYSWKDLNYTAKMLAISDVVTFEAQIYGRSFQGDVLALASAQLIPALKQIQEMSYINWGVNCWAPSPPSNIGTANSGGTVSAHTWWVIVTAVNGQGETLAYGGSSPVAASVVTTGGSSTISFNIWRVPGATSYRVYMGQGSTQPANSAMWRQSATTQFGGSTALNDPSTQGVKQGFFTVTCTADPATSGTAYSTIVSAGNTAQMFASSTYTGNTTSPLSFDGMQALIFANAAAAGAFGAQGETPLVVQPASTNGILTTDDIDTLHQQMYLNAQADPDVMFVPIVDRKKVSNLVSKGSNARINLPATDANQQSNLVAGYRATGYINQTTGKVIPIVQTPYLTQGTIIFGTYELPTTLQGINVQPFHIGYNRDMWSQIYPPDQSHPTQTLAAAFTNEAVVNQYLGGWAAITGILNQ